MIIRTVHNKENPYFMLNRCCLNDKRLSFKAKGIHTYLLSKPDHWKAYIEELESSSTDGRDAVRSGMKELIEYGYAVRSQERNEDGKFSTSDLDIVEQPYTGLPEAGLPHTDNPSADNPMLVINDIKENINTREYIPTSSGDATQSQAQAALLPLEEKKEKAPKKTKAPKKAKKEIHPAVVAHREVANRSMSRAQYTLVERVTNISLWKRAVEYVIGKGAYPMNIQYMLQVYDNPGKYGVPSSVNERKSATISEEEAALLLGDDYVSGK